MPVPTHVAAGHCRAGYKRLSSACQPDWCHVQVTFEVLGRQRLTAVLWILLGGTRVCCAAACCKFLRPALSATATGWCGPSQLAAGEGAEDSIPAAKLIAMAAELPFAAGTIPGGPASSGGGMPCQTWSPSLSLLSASGSACPATVRSNLITFTESCTSFYTRAACRNPRDGTAETTDHMTALSGMSCNTVRETAITGAPEVSIKLLLMASCISASSSPSLLPVCPDNGRDGGSSPHSPSLRPNLKPCETLQYFWR